jgi:hypothetical protein
MLDDPGTLPGNDTDHITHDGFFLAGLCAQNDQQGNADQH